MKTHQEQIKKIYGEKMLKLLKQKFPTQMENPQIVLKVLLSLFCPNTKTIQDDIIYQEKQKEFANVFLNKYIKLQETKQEEPKQIILNTKSPFEILKDANYTLYQCKTQEEILSFKKYYAKGEELCTFFEERLNTCLVFFAIKDNASNIKREDFLAPNREDEYSTSVLSIQFEKYWTNEVSIKSRYNHSVENPDATYSNDLDKIAKGLNDSFTNYLKCLGYNRKERGIKDLVLDGYIVPSDGRFYKYNQNDHINYYCPGNIIITSDQIICLNPNNKILIDNFVVDIEDKKIYQFRNSQFIEYDSFVDDLKEIKKINVYKKQNNKVIDIYFKDEKKKNAKILIDNNSNIIGYKNDNIQMLSDNFLHLNTKLKNISLPNVKLIQDNFLAKNTQIETIDLPNLSYVGDNFLINAKNLKNTNLPKIKLKGKNFLGLDNMNYLLHKYEQKEER